MFSLEEANDRLRAISEYITRILEGSDPILLGTFKHLEYLKKVSLGTEDNLSALEETSISAENPKLIILSCSGSFKEATDTAPQRAAAAYTIETPDSFENEFRPNGSIIKAHNSIEAELIAIYMALVTLVNLYNRPKYPIQVRLDNRACTNFLNQKADSKVDHIKEKVKGILDLTAQIPTRVDFVWYPRQSTKSLMLTNNWVQALIKHKGE